MSPVFKVAGVVLAVLTMATARSEEIEVASDMAPVKVRDQVVGQVAKGDRFEVLQRNSGWVAIEFSSEQGPRRGWVLSNHVKTLIEEESPAPDEPTYIVAGVDLKLDLVQVASQGTNGSLAMLAVLRNRGESDLEYDVENIRLLVDGRQVESVSRQAGSSRSFSDRVYAGFGDGGRMLLRYPQDLDFLESGRLPAGGTVQGWLRFPLAGVRRGSDLSKVAFRLQGKLGDEDFDFDLRNRAVSQLRAQQRPSELDESVPVIEVYGGLNALNFSALEAMVEQDNQNAPKAAPQAAPKAVVKMHGDTSILDPYVLDQLSSSPYQRRQSSRNRFVFVIDSASKSRQYLGGSYTMISRSLLTSESEAEAAILVLAQRDDATSVLKGFLAHPRPDVRAAAASGLAKFVQQEQVAAALIEAAKDQDRTVRAAAVHALGGYDWAIQPSTMSYRSQRLTAASPTQPVVSAVTAVLNDSDRIARLHAIRAAGRINDPQLIEELINRLEDDESGIVSAACSSLGELKAEAAVDALQQLRKSTDRSHRAAAISALGKIGTLSPVDTVIAQLNEGNPSYSDFQTLQKEADPRSVQPLIDYLASPHASSQYTDQAASTLGVLGDRRATDTLLKMLRFGTRYSTEVPEALGKLGDRRAIEPLREAAQVADMNSSRKAAIYLALLRLESDGVLEQMGKWLQEDPKVSGMSTSQLLSVIGNSKSEKATELLAPYLDDSSNLRMAAAGLLRQGTPEAVALIEERLMDESYKLGSTLLSVLMSSRNEQSEKLIRSAAKSGNETTRGAAENYLRTLDSRPVDRNSVHRSLIGKMYPAFEVEHWINGAAPTADDLTNKVILLDFWAVWCGPCIATFPELRRWHQEYGDDGLEIIGLTRYYGFGWDDQAKRPIRLDEKSERIEREGLKQFAKHHELKHRLAVLPSESDVTKQYGVTGIPQAVLIDRAGKIRLIKVGSGQNTAESIEAMILRCLKTLDFSGQALTDNELKEQLEEAGEFTRLNLQGTLVTADGLQALVDSKNLEHLDLDGTPVGDDALAVVQAIESLQSIGLAATRVTPEGVEQLRKARPDLEVRIDQWSSWMNRDDYQEYFNKVVKDGVFPLEVQAKVTEEGSRYRARFMPNPPDRDLVFRSMHGVTHAQYRQRETEALSRRMHAVSLTSFEDAEGTRRYSGTWVEGPNEVYWRTLMIAATEAREEALQHRAEGDLEAAAADCRRAIEAKPDYLLPHLTLGYVLLAMEQDEAAKKPFGEVARLVEQIPEDERQGSDWGYLGQALYRLGKWQESREALQRVIEIRGEKEPTVKAGPRWLYLAMTLHRLGKESEAQKIYQKLVEDAGEDGFQNQARLRDEAVILLRVKE